MRIQVSNFRKIEDADIDFSNLAIVAGNNEQGKSSLAQAVTSVITNNGNPFGLTKAEITKMINKGQEVASAKVETGTGNSHMTWPHLTFTANGEAPRGSLTSCGAIRIGMLSSKERGKLIIEALRAEPTEADLQIALNGAIPDPEIKTLWASIKKAGWDAMSMQYLDNAKTLKGQWREVTSETWGVQKAVSWRPLAANEEMLGRQLKEVEEELKVFEVQYKESIASTAVNEAEEKRLQELAGAVPKLKEEYLEIVKKQEELQKAIEEIRGKRANLPSLGLNEPTHDCPHCQGKLRITSHHNNKSDIRVEKFVEANNPAEKDKLQKERASLDGEEENKKAALSEVEKKLNEVKRKGKEGNEAASKLEEMRGKKAGKSEREIALYERDYKQAQVNLADFKKYHRARDVHNQIIQALEMGEILSSEGLRKKKLGEILSSFSSNIIAPLTEAFGLSKTVTISPDLTIFYGEHDYRFLSESAKFRVDTILQVAISKVEKADLMVIDGADIIVGKDRGGLVSMVLNSGIPTLILMSLKEEASLPKLGTAGRTYWVQDGKTIEINRS